ncbi:dienelactone hydrolase [Evansella vedderi]|uniref:Dienelactone hydrolase n=1 Tax=Evansella vedderi TaxID=38282 RepID=A0ABU0A2W4_9BACI|nr:acyl-CoA thioester hydrolase/BAAT C-terminal domain-containing protein [Evansella vedderi]MDQ0257018.1 dienelactone hydrolase [Evansella vedderi]
MKCFLYPDIGRVDEALQLHMDGLEPKETVTITMTMVNDVSGLWSSKMTTEADVNGKLLIGDHGNNGKNIFTELIWGLRPADSQTSKPMPADDTQPITLHIDLESTISQRKEARTVTRLFKEDYVLEESIHAEEINGIFYYPQNKRKLPSIILLGGLDGIAPNQTAALLASHGYGVLSLDYLGQPNQQELLSEVPIEQVHQAVDWLKHHPKADKEKILIFGSSKGAELALLAASKNKDIKGVIAYSPSQYVFQGLDLKRKKSSWSEQEKEVPYVPFSYTIGDFLKIIKSRFSKVEIDFSNIYKRSIEKYEQKDNRAAEIPVERIGGPILFVSGDEDALWPSVQMTEQMLNRLQKHSFPFDIKHLTYKQAGHILVQPYLPSLPENGETASYGGTPMENAISGESAWKETLKFIKEHFPPARIPTESIPFQVSGR